MDTGHLLQIILTVVVIAGAAGVALVCDLLKRNNEQLRELNVELRVRREEEQLREPQPEKAMAAAAGAASTQLARISADEGASALERAAEVTSRRGARTPEPVQETAEELPGASMDEARKLAREYMGGGRNDRNRTERPAAEVKKSTMMETPNPRAIAARMAAAKAPVAPKAPAPKPTSAVETTPAVTEVVRAENRVIVNKKNWDMLLKSNKRTEPATIEMTEKGKGEVIPFESHHDASESQLPEGFFGLGDVSRLLNSTRTIQGLVVAIGINDLPEFRNEHGGLAAQALLAKVGEHIRSMVRPGDFACQASEDEYVLISAEENGSAQRRLSEIAEMLWNFQFEAVGTSTILFSWGGSEAKGEPMNDAVAAAIERMNETRNNRRITDARRRKAV